MGQIYGLTTDDVPVPLRATASGILLVTGGPEMIATYHYPGDAGENDEILNGRQISVANGRTLRQITVTFDDPVVGHATNYAQLQVESRNFDGSPEIVLGTFTTEASVGAGVVSSFTLTATLQLPNPVQFVLTQLKAGGGVLLPPYTVTVSYE